MNITPRLDHLKSGFPGKMPIYYRNSFPFYCSFNMLLVDFSSQLPVSASQVRKRGVGNSFPSELNPDGTVICLWFPFFFPSPFIADVLKEIAAKNCVKLGKMVQHSGGLGLEYDHTKKKKKDFGFPDPNSYTHPKSSCFTPVQVIQLISSRTSNLPKISSISKGS